MIAQKILILIQDAEVPNTKLKFPKGTEFEIVADIVYMSGFPIPQEMQRTLYNWLVANMGNTKIFKEDLRRFS